MVQKVLPFFAFITVLTGLDIINHNCNFPTLNTCLRIDDINKMKFNEMKNECEKYDLTMMPAKTQHFGKLRSILWFRYDQVTQLPLGVHVSKAQELANIKTVTGLKVKGAAKTGWVIYNYLEDNLALVPLETELPIVCWSPFKTRLKCPPDFKLIYPRLTCYGVITINQQQRKWTNDECKNDCRNKKSNLGAFHTQQERLDYVKKLGLRYAASLWVGTRFEVDSNKYKGADKLAVRKTAYNMDGSKWTNFNNAFTDDEPNAYGGLSENCVEWRMWQGDKKSFNDLTCTDKLSGCVCETAPDQTNVQY
uniref:C-type lectin domain-containing protein n=1 Tax=Panagrellus redivivus TaxID=6233 RepID=A0A7E5A0E4_PANRE